MSMDDYYRNRNDVNLYLVEIIPLAERLGFAVVSKEKNYTIMKSNWSSEMVFETAREVYQFLVGYEYGHRAAKKEMSKPE